MGDSGLGFDMNSLEDFVQHSIHLLKSSNTNTQTPLTDFIDQVQNLKEEDDRSLEDLKVNIRGLENTRETTKQELASLEKKIEVLKKEKDNLQEQKLVKRKHLARVRKQHENQERTVLQIQKQLQRVPESRLILDRNRDELLLYKVMTGISWDFKAPVHSIVGFVTNKETSFLKRFNFSKKEMSSWQITKALWDLILQSSLKCSQSS